jgi:hypothetical protein
VLVEKCVGSRIAGVERVLTLAALRRCRGNGPQAADLPGISLRALRGKLPPGWREIMPPEAVGENGGNRGTQEPGRTSGASGGWI